MKHEISTLIGKNCITPGNGQRVYDLVHPELLADLPVELDFAGVEIFASPFFNFAIGQLLRDIPPSQLKAKPYFTWLLQFVRQILSQNATHVSIESEMSPDDEVL